MPDTLPVELSTEPLPAFLADRGLAARAADAALVAETERARPRPVRPGLFAHSPPIREVPAPDGSRLAGTSDADLYIRSVASGDTLWLTDDGTKKVGWDVEGAR